MMRRWLVSIAVLLGGLMLAGPAVAMPAMAATGHATPASGAPQTATISVQPISGAGTVSDGARIDCTDSAGGTTSGTCSETVDSGTTVTMTETPAAGWIFTGWTGACAGTASSCPVVMSANQTVGATFGLANPTLTVTTAGSGKGSVADTTGAISCPGTCSASYANGTNVTLTATPVNGAGVSWTGCATSSGDTCSVSMTTNTAVTATFNPPQLPLQVTVAGNGTGSVTDTAGAINCPGTCSATYPTGSQVTLTAAPAGGAVVEWSGCTTSSGNTCSVAMDADAAVTVSFEQNATLTISTAGDGSGTVYDDTRQIICPGTCSATYLGGTQVTLSAVPAPYSVVEWSGCTSKNGNTCTVTVNGAASVTAAFYDQPTDLTAPTISGPRAGRGYVARSDFAADTTLRCNPGTWHGQGLHYYYTWTANASGATLSGDGPNARLITPDTPGFNRPVTVNCSIQVVDPYGGWAQASVNFILVPAQPKKLTAPTITAGVPVGSSNTCNPGRYSWLYPSSGGAGAGPAADFSYRWIVSNGHTNLVESLSQTITVKSAWKGDTLSCEVIVDPHTGWTSFTEKSRGYVVEQSVKVKSPPYVTILTAGPNAALSTKGHAKPLSITAQDVDLTCHPGSLALPPGKTTYSYEWISATGAVVQGQHLHLDMNPGSIQYALSIRCDVHVTTPGHQSLHIQSVPVAVASGCQEAIEEGSTLNEPEQINLAAIANGDTPPNDAFPVSVWAYEDQAGQANGVSLIHGADSTSGLPFDIAVLGALYVGDVATSDSFVASPDPYPTLSGAFDLKATGVPGTSPWHWGVVAMFPGERGSGFAENTPASHQTAHVAGPNCSAYAHYLSKVGYQVKTVTASQLIPTS